MSPVTSQPIGVALQRAINHLSDDKRLFSIGCVPRILQSAVVADFERRMETQVTVVHGGELIDYFATYNVVPDIDRGLSQGRVIVIIHAERASDDQLWSVACRVAEADGRMLVVSSVESMRLSSDDNRPYRIGASTWDLAVVDRISTGIIVVNNAPNLKEISIPGKVIDGRQMSRSDVLSDALDPEDGILWICDADFAARNVLLTVLVGATARGHQVVLQQSAADADLENISLVSDVVDFVCSTPGVIS